ISATDQNGNYRGIGIHARADDKLSSTNGCVRTSNADVNLLSQYIKSGTKVKIQN
ncbi:MAG: L,D-transpeptidase, partial [Candidatus Niyogibacteria bacterium]|nr:L,D-transpeptidase [Candidatus Niyogibacteria bacterium]